MLRVPPHRARPGAFVIAFICGFSSKGEAPEATEEGGGGFHGWESDGRKMGGWLSTEERVMEMRYKATK